MQQESVDDAERNRFLVNYVDYAFDDFGGRQPPVYPGLSTVWGSLARSKACQPIFLFEAILCCPILLFCYLRYTFHSVILTGNQLLSL